MSCPADTQGWRFGADGLKIPPAAPSWRSCSFSIANENAMPTYAYLCAACGHKLEAVQKMSEDALKDCPHCGKPELARQISAVGFALKGSGWYVTDFRDKGKTKAGGSESTDTTTKTETASTPAATETKPSSSSGEAA